MAPSPAGGHPVELGPSASTDEDSPCPAWGQRPREAEPSGEGGPTARRPGRTGYARLALHRRSHEETPGPDPGAHARVIRAIVFDLDNTLTDFMRMKEAAIQAAIDGMIDAGFDRPREELRRRVQVIYDERGLEFQRVFDELLEREFGEVDPKILASGIVAYRRARESELVLYPHAQMTLLELAKRGIRLGVVSDAPRFQVWLRLCSLGLQHLFDAVVTFDDTGE